MGMSDLTAARIQKVCTDRSYERGVDYYESGRITSIRAVGTSVRATVEGTDVYDVELAWRGKRGGLPSYSCTCPYSWGGECKHVVAALLHTMDHSAEMIRDAEAAASSIKRLVAAAGEQYIREFVAGEMAGDAGIAERFAKGMGGGRAVAGLNYYDRIAQGFRRTAEAEDARRGYIDEDYIGLGEVMEAARGFAESGDMAEASRIYGQIAGAIAAHMGRVYDDGEHHDTACKAIAKWAGCFNKGSPSPAQRRAHIALAFGRFRSGNINFRGDYESAMWSLCKSRGDLEHVLGLVAPHAQDPPAGGPDDAAAGTGGGRGGKRPRRTRRRAERLALEAEERRRMLRVRTTALGRLGRTGDVDRALAAHARADPAVCAARVGRLARAGSKARAVRAAIEGLDRFGHDKSIAGAAIKVYGRRDPGRRTVLSGLFLRTLDWSYCDQLRRLPGWPRERAALLARLSRDKKRPDRLIDMLAGEGMHKRALREIAALGDASLFEHYIGPVSKRYPRAYLVAYGHCIREMASGARTQARYKQVARHLRAMSAVAGGKRASRELAGILAEMHPRKPLFLRALSAFLR